MSYNEFDHICRTWYCSNCKNREKMDFNFDQRHDSLICIKCGCEVSSYFSTTCNTFRDSERVSYVAQENLKKPNTISKTVNDLVEYLLKMYNLTGISKISKDVMFFYTVYTKELHRKIVVSCETLASALFLLACKSNGFKFAFKDVAAIVTTDIYTQSRKINALFLLIESKSNLESNENVLPAVDLSVLNAVLNKMQEELTFQKRNDIIKIYNDLYINERIAGLNPLTMTSIALYLALKKDDPTKDKELIVYISIKVSISIATIKKAYGKYLKN